MAGILSRRRWLVLSFLSASVGFVYLLSSPFKSSLTHDSSYRTPPEDNAAVSPDSLRVQAGVGQVLDQSSPTLSVLSQILVISRPSRLDRRATMEQLRAALGLDWDYVDAISSDDQAVTQIADCLRLSRKHAHLRTFEWPSRSEVDQIVLSPLPISPNTSVSWLAPTSDTLCRYPVPPASNASVQAADLGDFSRSQNTPPMETSRNHHSRATSSVPLTCAVQDRTHGVKYTPSLLSYMLLTPAKFACWYSHLEAIQRVAAFNEPLVDPEGGGTAALILEDDVDIERDIRERLREAWSVLPDDWDIVFLGEWLVLSSLQASFTILCQATVGRMRLVIPHFARRASPSHLDHSRRCPSTPHSRPSARMRTPSAALELAAFCSIYYTLRLRTRGRSTKHSHGSSKAGGSGRSRLYPAW